MIDDSELLRRYALSQSEEAFGELVRRHLNLVFRAAMRQNGGDAHRAQDVAQVVFTLLAQRASALAEHGSLAGWLHATTGNTVRNALREERRRRAREAEAVFMNAETSGIDVARKASLPGELLDEALSDLGRRDREAILLRFF